MFVKEWRAILGGAWSVWFAAIATVLSALVGILENLDPDLLGVSPAQFAAVMCGLNLAVILSRILAQPALSAKVRAFLDDQSGAVSRRGVAGLTAAALVAAVTMVGQFEGLRTQAYKDAVGVWTICYGETLDVSPGDTATPAECAEMLADRVAEFDRAVGGLIDDQVEAELPDGVRIAIVSWAYNVGIGAAKSSTLIRLVNARDFRGACEQLPRWNRAGGKVLRGLTNRRLSERAVCLKGLSEV